jgi:hypothetical protein
MVYIKQFTTVNFACCLTVDCYFLNCTIIVVIAALERGWCNLSTDVPFVNTLTILVVLLIVEWQGLVVVAFVTDTVFNGWLLLQYLYYNIKFLSVRKSMKMPFHWCANGQHIQCIGRDITCWITGCCYCCFVVFGTE